MLMMLSFPGLQPLSSPADAHDAVILGDLSPCPAQKKLMMLSFGLTSALAQPS